MPRSPIICVCDFRILAMCVVVFGAAGSKCGAGGSVYLVGPLQLSQNRFHRRSTHSYSYFFVICTGHKLRSHIHSFKESVRHFIARKKYAPAIAALVFVVGYSNLTTPFRLLNIPPSPLLFDRCNASRHSGAGLADTVLRFVGTVSRSGRGELRK